MDHKTMRVWRGGRAEGEGGERKKRGEKSRGVYGVEIRVAGQKGRLCDCETDGNLRRGGLVF